jgi:rhodanese-related sulfurtransferase
MMFGRRSIESITARAASDRFFTGELVLVDVRTRHEFEQLRIPGALHIPLHEVRGRLDELRTDHAVAFLCRSGHRSAVAARRAATRRTDVVNVAGGMNAWLAAGLPTADCQASRSKRRPR